MIDMHCHLDLYPNPLQLLDEVVRRNLFTFVVTTSPRAWKATSRVFAGHANLEIGLGLHPEIVSSKFQEKNMLIDEVKNCRFIGEVGLDGSSEHKGSLHLQAAIFDDLLSECQIYGEKIISIHSRGATKMTLDMLDKYPKVGTPILHWFSGTEKELYRAIERGCWFSVGPVMLRSKKGADLLKIMPLDRVLPESDGPFARINNLPVMPWESFGVTEVISQLFGMSIVDSRRLMISNLKKLII